MTVFELLLQTEPFLLPFSERENVAVDYVCYCCCSCWIFFFFLKTSIWRYKKERGEKSKGRKLCFCLPGVESYLQLSCCRFTISHPVLRHAGKIKPSMSLLKMLFSAASLITISQQCWKIHSFGCLNQIIVAKGEISRREYKKKKWVSLHLDGTYK